MKFAQVGYGHDGRGSGKDRAGYTYLVNDNVRAQDKLQPVVRHYGNGALFVTQGKVLATGKTFQGARKPETREIMQKAALSRQDRERQDLLISRRQKNSERPYTIKNSALNSQVSNLLAL